MTGCDGGFPRSRRRISDTLLWGVLVLFLLPTALWAQTPEGVRSVGQVEEVPPAPPAPPVSTHRDSLLIEIHRYSDLISSMRDSLDLENMGLELDEAQRLRVEQSIDHVTRMIEQIGEEMGDMDLRITNNRISLLDPAGEGIVINIPENLDEQISEGFNVISQLILSELPDTVRFGDSDDFAWTGFKSIKPKGKRKIIQGNMVKVGDPARVAANEDVRGHVVVVFGDAEISGRVDGNVVVVMGDLALDASAEVTGEIVTVGGRLDQDPDADVGDVVVVDSWNHFDMLGLDARAGSGLFNFLLTLGEFLLMLIFVGLVMTLVPNERIKRVLDFMDQKPLPSLGAGLAVAVVGHVAVLVLIAILVITVIGIPVALLVGVAMLALAALSVGLAAVVLGRKVCLREGGCPAPWMTVVLGLLALHLVSFVGALAGLWPALSGVALLLTILGLSIKFCAFVLGMGALILSRLGTRAAV